MNAFQYFNFWWQGWHVQVQPPILFSSSSSLFFHLFHFLYSLKSPFVGEGRWSPPYAPRCDHTQIGVVPPSTHRFASRRLPPHTDPCVVVKLRPVVTRYVFSDLQSRRPARRSEWPVLVFIVLFWSDEGKPAKLYEPPVFTGFSGSWLVRPVPSRFYRRTVLRTFRTGYQIGSWSNRSNRPVRFSVQLVEPTGQILITLIITKSILQNQINFIKHYV